MAIALGTIGFAWGLPNSDTWSADAISPRACGLGAIAESYWPGHFHQYPPLHMLLLTALSLPWMALAAARAGTDRDALERALLEPLPMTAIEVSARLVALAMFAGIAWCTATLWTPLAGRRAGIAAGLVVATNATLVYYAHTGNLEVPYLFWTMLALVEIDRVLGGEEARATRTLLAVVAAALTKDQAAGTFALVLPACLLVRPALARSRATWKAAGVAAAAYAVVSGAVVNPTGFAKRVALLLGPASADWATYPKGWGGRAAIARDVVLSVPRYSSWWIAAAAFAGIAIVAAPGRGRRVATDRARALMPLLGAASFTLLFTFGARRTEDRFVLPQSVLVLPYACIAFEALASRARAAWSRAALAAACIVAVAPALLGAIDVDATLLADARYDAERFLAALPPGTRVEMYGGPRFLPRIPGNVVAVRVGEEDPRDRTRMPRLEEVRARPADLAARAPAYVLLSTEFSHAQSGAAAPSRYGVTSYTSADDARFFADLDRGALGYARVATFECVVPWPLKCRAIHGSTGMPIWIYGR